MSNRKVFAAALCMVTMPAAVLAQTSQYTAALAQPLATPRDIFARENMWHCKDMTCLLVSRPINVTSATTCSVLRRQVGALTFYGTSEHPMEAADLAKCNGSSGR